MQVQTSLELAQKIRHGLHLAQPEPGPTSPGLPDTRIDLYKAGLGPIKKKLGPQLETGKVQKFGSDEFELRNKVLLISLDNDSSNTDLQIFFT